jgi:hypothetical protein
MIIRPVEAVLFHADGRTARHEAVRGRFSQTCKARKILRSAHRVYLYVLCGSQN